MTSKIKVDNINKVSDDSNIINKCGTSITMGQNGDTVIIPNGVTEQVQSGGDIQVQSGGQITIASGATITNNGTQVGFGREGAVNWNTSIKSGDFTAASGEGYFINTTGGAVEMTLPATPSVGDIVAFKDYAGTFQTHALTVNRNGVNIVGGTVNPTVSTEGQAVVLVYGDTTQGWQPVEGATNADLPRPSFIVATGGCTSTCGNDRIHKFNGPGTFTVTCLASCAANNVVSYLVVAGGGGGSSDWAGGGGGGGFREYKSSSTPYTASPLDGNPCGTAITVTATGYPIAVGGGGGGGNGGGGECGPARQGSNGSVSTFSTITSAGGGTGGVEAPPTVAGSPGGSGGGAWYNQPGPVPSGNDPSTTPPQGSNGGAGGGPVGAGGGGGGATAAGSAGGPGGAGGGGVGATTQISGSPLAYAGGGGGTAGTGGPASPCGTGGSGGGSPNNNPGSPGTTNRGGGGGAGGYSEGSGDGGTGGSGVVIIRYRYQ